MNLKSLILFFIFLASFYSTAKPPSSFSFEQYAFQDTLRLFENSPIRDKHRSRIVNYSIIAGYGLSMTWLYTQWYKDYPTSSFHFFNDNGEWEGLDKFGHFWNAYSISKGLSHCYRWAGYDEKKAMLYGMGITFLYQTTVEVFDGFSEEWGFSPGDMFANLGGLAFFSGQQLLWNEQRMVLKYSFHQTEYTQYNPKLLGTTLPENILKDYNGQTYWLTINPRSFFKSSAFPRWLSLALGYGADGMTGGMENPSEVDGEAIPTFERYRQFYISIDFDLARIKTKSHFLSGLFKLINIVHLPAPAIELSPGRKVVYHGFYF